MSPINFPSSTMEHFKLFLEHFEAACNVTGRDPFDVLLANGYTMDEIQNYTLIFGNETLTHGYLNNNARDTLLIEWRHMLDEATNVNHKAKAVETERDDLSEEW